MTVATTAKMTTGAVMNQNHAAISNVILRRKRSEFIVAERPNDPRRRMARVLRQQEA
jgi:hypothetical protein